MTAAVLIEVLVITGILGFSVFLLYWGLKSERIFVKSREELILLLETIYREVRGTVCVVAGEANRSVYEKICSLVEELLSKGENLEIEIIIGPVVSVSSEDLKLVQSGKISPSLHPLFTLMERYPERVKVYYKTDTSFSNVRHFVIAEDKDGNNLLYVEKLHPPLKESEAVFIKNPNPILIRKYIRLFNKLKSSKRVKRLNLQNLRIVKFSDFQFRKAA